MQLQICTDRNVSTWAVKPQRHTVGLNRKSRQKLNCKNSGKLTVHTYTCNSFTSLDMTLILLPETEIMKNA